MSVKPVSMKEMLRDLPDEKIGMYVVKRYNKFIIIVNCRVVCLLLLVT